VTLRRIPLGGLVSTLLRSAVVATALFFAPAAGAREEETKDEEKVVDPPYTQEFRDRVNEAVAGGVAHLKRTQSKDGTWGSMHNEKYPTGATALATLALLKCGVKADDPAVVKAFGFLAGKDLVGTYETSLLLMAIAAKYDGSYDAFQPEEEDRPGKGKAKSPCAGAISKEDLASMRRGVTFLVETQKPTGMWRYPDGVLDVSNTQYALFGLQAANRCGPLVEDKVWAAALRFLVGNQEVQGAEVLFRGNEVRGAFRYQWNEAARARGFRYVPTFQPGALPTGSTTAAGVAALIICQSELWGSRHFDGSVRKAARRAIRDAFAWLQAHYDVTTNPAEVGTSTTPAQPPDPQAPVAGKDTWHLYYLYGLAAAGVLGRVRFLGEHDWYREGAEVLLKRRQGEGSWGDTTETCFALLFLKRATTRHGAPVITPFEKAASKPVAEVPGGAGGGPGGAPK
jgi:hypothetical protein